MKRISIYYTPANVLTFIRLLGAIGLFFIPVQTIFFYSIYTLCGITDALDGWVARKTHSTSTFGARLDSIADLLFFSAMLLRLIPELWIRLSLGVWIGVGAVLLIRLNSYAVAALKYHRFASLHTYGNKLTGFLLFTLPYWMMFGLVELPCTVICVVAGLASAEELLIHLLSPAYNANTQTLYTLAARGRS